MLYSKQVDIVVFAGGFPKKSQIEILKSNNIKAICFATTLIIARKMIQNGIDALILEGNEAGGHIGPCFNKCFSSGDSSLRKTSSNFCSWWNRKRRNHSKVS